MIIHDAALDQALQASDIGWLDTCTVADTNTHMYTYLHAYIQANIHT